MSEMAKQARAAMKAKASKLTTADPHQKVDSSTWTPPEALNTEVKTGMRPVSRRAFKKGGKVMGEKAQCNLGRKPRKSGGKALTANSLISRNVKEANEERPGGKAHIGGLKTGGRAKKQGGGYLASADFGDENAVPNPRRTAEDEPISPAMAARMRGIMDQSAAESRRANEDVEAQRLLGIRGYKRGGATKKAMGGPMAGSQKMMQDAQNVAGVPASILDSAPAQSRFSKQMGLKKGGTAKHDDVKQDMALIKKMVKPSARKGRDAGGRLAGEYTRMAQADRKEYDALKDMASASRGNALSAAAKWAKADKDADRTSEQTGYKRETEASKPYEARKSGGKTMRKGRADGGVNDPRNGTINDPRNPAPGILIMKPGTTTGQGGTSTGSDKERTFDSAKIKRKSGGGVFSGPGYPGKVPGVTGGRIARATGGKTKGKGKTSINIMIAAGKPANPQEMMGPPPGMDAGPQGMPIAVPPPQGAMPAPMPMPMPVPVPMPQGAPVARKSGGRLTKVAHSYKDMEAGAGSGEGRLQKTDIAKARAYRKAGGKVGHRTYRSYKDMDAGAGSGLGRLEKTEIQKHKH